MGEHAATGAGGRPSLFDPAMRGVRVQVLLVAVILMSAADLYMTLVHLGAFGMFEGNPIARLIMQYNCPWLLGVWKLATVAVGVVILFTWRKHRIAELGTLACFVILSALTVQWMRYSEQVSRSTPLMHALAAERPATFVRMSPEP